MKQKQLGNAPMKRKQLENVPMIRSNKEMDKWNENN